MGAGSSREEELKFSDGSVLKVTEYPSNEGLRCELQDGKVLGYQVYGAVDGEIKSNLLFFHGTPGSRFFFPQELSEKLKAVGVRAFVVERPGFGLSTPEPQRTLLSWAEKDIPAFADALNLEKFAVMGYSAGAPYALACAARLKDRVTKALIISSLCPPNVPGITSGMSIMNQIGWFLSKNWRGLLSSIVESEGKGVIANPKHKLHEMMSNGSRVDIAAYDANPTIQRLFIQSGLEMYHRQNWTSEIEDYWIFGHPWGFEVADIKEVPVHFWAGSLDMSTTLSMSNYLSRTIPNCKAKIVQDKGHMLFFELYDEYVEALSS